MVSALSVASHDTPANSGTSTNISELLEPCLGCCHISHSLDFDGISSAYNLICCHVRCRIN